MHLTEIQWLVNLMIKYKLSDEVKELCLERIGEVEASGRPIPVTRQNAVPAMFQGQAPSTVARMEAQTQGEVSPTVNISPIAPTLPPRNVAPVEVSTGNGTRGPRKF